MAEQHTFLISEIESSCMKEISQALGAVEGLAVSFFNTVESALGHISLSPGYIIMETSRTEEIDCIAIFRDFLPKSRIFILSDRNDIRSFEEALGYGADYYFLKSDCSAGDLVGLIRNYISSRELSPKQWFEEYLNKKKKKQKEKKIFHLDDNASSADLVGRLISMPAGTFKSFTNSIDFLHEFYKNKPDIVILDYDLEEKITGLELLKIVKNVNPRIEVIILSKQEKASVASDLMCNGADHYIMKSNENLRKLKTLLEVSASGSEARL